jgi:hypothetical protein
MFDLTHQFETNLCACLAHSAVFFSRQEWKAVGDAVNGPTVSSSSTSQAETQQQVGGQGGGAGSSTIVSGANLSRTVGGSVILTGSKDSDTVNISSSDPDVLEAALASNTSVSNTAIGSNTSLALDEANESEATATAAIAASTDQVLANDQFGLAAIDAAANEDAYATTAVESASTQSQVTAQDALAAAQNTLTAGVAPSQEFQTSGTASLQTQTQTWATWITIISGVIAVWFFFLKKK